MSAAGTGSPATPGGAPTHQVELAGAPLAWDETGDGPAVALLLHGFPHGRWLWTAAARAMVAGHPTLRCVAPDLPGFGASPARPGPVTLDGWADLCAVLLDHLGVDRAAVAGLSMGGYLALALVRRHPDRVRALVLADTRAAADTDAVRERRRALADVARREGVAAVADAQLDGALGRTTRQDAARVAAFRAAMAGGASVEGIVGALAAMADRPDATPLLAALRVPTLVVGGAEDALTRPSELQALAAAISGARLALLDGAGHASAWERPDAFAAVAGPVLAGDPAAGRAAG